MKSGLGEAPTSKAGNVRAPPARGEERKRLE